MAGKSKTNKRKSGASAESESKRPSKGKTLDSSVAITMDARREDTDQSLPVNTNDNSAGLAAETEEATQENDELLPVESLNPNDDIANIKTILAKTQKQIDDIGENIDKGKEILRAWNDLRKRNALLSENRFIHAEIKGGPPGEQENELETYIVRQTRLLEGLLRDRGIFLRKEEDLVKGKKRPEELNEAGFLRNNANDEESGIFYLQYSFQIGLETDTSSKIGLLTRTSNNGVHLKDTTKPFVLSKILMNDEWSLIKIDSSEKKFLDNLLLKVPALAHSHVTSAWNGLNNVYDLVYEPSLCEMFFQQSVCTPFSLLLRAAAGTSGVFYKADLHVYSSMSVVCKRNEDDPTFTKMTLDIKPDASVTLTKDWDAYGMLEIKSAQPCNQREYLIDNDKCVLMTATTAIAVKKSIDALDLTDEERKMHYEKVVLPFIVVTRHYASLYVTRLNENGNPEVNHVLYPSNGEGEKKGQGGRLENDKSTRNVISDSPCDARKKLFVTFAVLLNRFKTYFDKSDIERKYNEQVGSRSVNVELLDKLTLTGKPSGVGKGKEKTSKNKNESSSEHFDSKSRQERCAKEAAQNGGMFVDLVFPFTRFLSFEDHATDDDDDYEDERIARFYFKGRSMPSIVGAPTQDVFLKVWRADEVDIEAVESEWRYHNRALKAGVPVAAPVLTELARSPCGCGIEYVMLAVEFIHEDKIETTEQLLHFSCSLIKTVLTLHEKAKLLHCDLKPANVLWGDGMVKLIDFEHAQDITDVAWAPGTVGYQAPEILNEMPCSKGTDAYSVGKIISTRMEIFQKDSLLAQDKQTCDILYQVSLRLTDSKPERRWTLSEALHAIQDMPSYGVTVNIPPSIHSQIQQKHPPVIPPMH